MNLNDIFKEADEVITKHAKDNKASSSTQTKTASVDPEVATLAQEVLKGSYDQATASEKIASPKLTNMEKIAHSMAVVDTLINLSGMAKLEKTAQVALDSGYSEEQVADYIEKKASTMEFVSVAALIKDNFEGVESEKTAGIRQSLGKQ